MKSILLSVNLLLQLVGYAQQIAMSQWSSALGLSNPSTIALESISNKCGLHSRVEFTGVKLDFISNTAFANLYAPRLFSAIGIRTNSIFQNTKGANKQSIGLDFAHRTVLFRNGNLMYAYGLDYGLVTSTYNSDLGAFGVREHFVLHPLPFINHSFAASVKWERRFGFHFIGYVNKQIGTGIHQLQYAKSLYRITRYCTLYLNFTQEVHSSQAILLSESYRSHLSLFLRHGRYFVTTIGTRYDWKNQMTAVLKFGYNKLGGIKGSPLKHDTFFSYSFDLSPKNTNYRNGQLKTAHEVLIQYSF